MFDVAHTWPWSATAFWPAFLIGSAILVGLSILIATILADVLDGPVRTATSTPPSRSAPTSSGGNDSRDTLLVGRLPQQDQVFVAAFLKGQPFLEAALAAAAMSAGWVRRRDGDTIDVIPDVTPDEPLLAQLKDVLDDAGAGETPRARLRTAALRLRPMLQARAEAMGLVRPADRRGLVVLVGLAGVVVALPMGLLRLAVAPGDRVEVLGIILAVEAVFAVLVTMRLTARHRQARAWLRFCDDVIGALRADVRVGQTTSTSDIVLVAATDGLPLGKTGERLGLDVFAR